MPKTRQSRRSTGSSPLSDGSTTRGKGKARKTCDACHASKRKCDGKEPCSNCRTKSTLARCNYVTDNPDLRPFSGDPEVVCCRAKIGTLENAIHVRHGHPMTIGREELVLQPPGDGCEEMSAKPIHSCLDALSGAPSFVPFATQLPEKDPTKNTLLAKSRMLDHLVKLSVQMLRIVVETAPDSRVVRQPMLSSTIFDPVSDSKPVGLYLPTGPAPETTSIVNIAAVQTPNAIGGVAVHHPIHWTDPNAIWSTSPVSLAPLVSPYDAGYGNYSMSDDFYPLDPPTPSPEVKFQPTIAPMMLHDHKSTLGLVFPGLFKAPSRRNRSEHIGRRYQ